MFIRSLTSTLITPAPFPHLAVASLSLLVAVSRPPVLAAQGTAPAVELRRGMIITQSVRVIRKTYTLPAGGADSAILTIRGDNVVVDFDGATLAGSDPLGDPDQAAGVGIRIDGGRNVTIRNARIRGYKVAILARGTHHITLQGNDLSYNWKPRLYSLVEHESLVDWLSFHHNEKDEWLRYGAAAYLVDVRGGRIAANHVTQGMNALLLVRTDSLDIRDNDFSFNSGLGIGLYRSSDNTIVRNRLDFNVRGYSHGFYRRGQDSADLLLYEQSDRNVVAWNSATHGGDGLFLWAGQSTMDSGEGGANDNVFFGNDFSFAPANGMEATFSRNRFIANRAVGNDYGLWGGYSYSSAIIANCFAGNRFGIAIEHGQDNEIAANRFLGDSTAIRLWGDSIEPSDWGYPKHRDTRSRDYRITGNTFAGNRTVLFSRNTSGVTDAGNDSTRSTTGGCEGVPPVPGAYARYVPSLPGVTPTFPTSPLMQRDRSAMIVDEWGPYDWRSPKLWPVDSTHAVPLRLAVLGPPGRWRVVDRRGVERLSKSSGSTNDTIVVTPAPQSRGDWSLMLEYVGGETVSPRGVVRGAGQTVRFGYDHFEPIPAWQARFVAWSDSTDPRTHAAAFAALFAKPPLLARRESRLDYEWYSPTIKGLPQNRYALEATAAVDLPAGTYTLRTISDDGIRVWVDGKLVIDRWDLHGSTVDAVPVTAGRHALRVQYFQIDGWAELRVDIVRGAQRPGGSPEEE